MPWLRAISTNIPTLLDGIETSYTFETPRKRIPVIKGIPKVLKGGPPMKRGTLSLSDRGPIRLRSGPMNNVGASLANKGVLTSTTRTKTVASKTASVPTIESLDPWQIPNAERMLGILTWDRLPLRRRATLNQERRLPRTLNPKLAHVTFVTSQDTSHQTALTKRPTSKTRRPSFSRTRTSWFFGRKPGMTAMSRRAQPE